MKLLKLTFDAFHILLSASMDNTDISWNLASFDILSQTKNETIDIYRALKLLNSTTVLTGSQVGGEVREFSLKNYGEQFYSRNIGINITSYNTCCD
jgi:hypothetical protein